MTPPIVIPEPGMPHPTLVICKRNNIVHYSGKSYSDQFQCPWCYRRGRFNLQYLGLRKVCCTGKKFVRVLESAWATECQP